MSCYTVKNSNSHVAICTLWYNIPNVIEHDFNIIGYCRTKPGVHLMAITLLELNQITDLIVITNEPRGMLEHINKLNDMMNSLLDNYLTNSVGNSVEKSEGNNKCLIRIHYSRWEDLNTSIIPKTPLLHKSIKIIKEENLSTESLWPSKTGYNYTSKSIITLYHYVLHQLFRRGRISKVRDQITLSLHVVVLTLRSQSSKDMLEALVSSTFPRSILEDYIQRFYIPTSSTSSTSSNSLEENENDTKNTKTVVYEYTQRLLSMTSLDEIVRSLSNTRSWYPIFHPSDLLVDEKPCCVGIQLILSSAKVLDMVVIFRSNDMNNAWPLNCLGMRYLHEQVYNHYVSTVSRLITLGSLTTISNNAHCYDILSDDLFKDSGIKILENRLLSDFKDSDFEDPEGYYVVSKSDNNIIIAYYDQYANHIKDYSRDYRDYEKMIRIVVQDISSPSHAAYIAKEITKTYYSMKDEKYER